MSFTPADLLTQPLAASSAAPPLHRFSVEEYHAAASAGVFGGEQRVELLQGLIVDMSPIGSHHRYVVHELTHALEKVLPSGRIVYCQQPVTLPTSEPQPDMAVVRGSNADYLARHPVAAEIDLIVEASDTTLKLDRDQKLEVYAAAGIPEYWIVNLIDRQVEIHRNPQSVTENQPATYSERRVLKESDDLSVTIDGNKIGRLAIHNLLPHGGPAS